MVERPRPSQQRVLQYTGGKMGISAVPGSGKTWTLSRLAAKLVREAPLRRDQQVLVVTLVNSARGKFEQEVRDLLQDTGLGVGYRVRTLHGLANDIVSERPGLVGLSDEFQILDEEESESIVRDSYESWWRAHPEFKHFVFKPEEINNRQALERWRDDAPKLAFNFIKQAKDLNLEPAQIREALNEARASTGQDLPLAAMCLDLYEAYERGLRYRGAVDFQDLIRLALRALETDTLYLARLRRRWPYILEDEAQDSSQLQEQILRKLAGEDGNWVRVGDPNQAIYETFTTANPKFLRDFLREPGVTAAELPESGRSTWSIIRLANHLIEWSLNHPNEAIRLKRPLDRPLIQPAESNPPDQPDHIAIMPNKYTPVEERKAIAASLKKALQDNPEQTIAVLMTMNHSGTDMAKVLREQKIDYIEHLRTTSSTRRVAARLRDVLFFLADPTRPAALANVYRAWRHSEGETAEVTAVAKRLTTINAVEAFIAPRGRDALEDLISGEEEAPLRDHLETFRAVIGRWQGAALLPPDQLILTLAGDLFSDAAEIATAYSLAVYLRDFAILHSDARLPHYAAELADVALNRRRFTGLNEDDEQFDPSRHKGKAVIMTLHGAKGLEWDRVYLMSVNNYDFPSADPFDSYLGEKWYARDKLDLQAEAFAQLQAALNGTPYVPGEATREARVDYAAERLRLLYVGITRAKKELIITWNTGRDGNLYEAKPLPELREWWNQERDR